MATRKRRSLRQHTRSKVASRNRPKSSALGEKADRTSPTQLRKLSAVDRLAIPEPRTIGEKLDWVEIRGRPDYLDQRFDDPGGGVWFVPPSNSVVAYGREIQRVYHAAFEEAGGAGRLRVLRRYAANFPQCAFDPEGWLWPHWQEWRPQRQKTDRASLDALASGLRDGGGGWMSRTRARIWRLALAKKRLSAWQSDEELIRVYREYLVEARSHDEETRRTTEKRLLPRLLSLLERKTGCRTSSAELKRRTLSVVLRRAASTTFDVRERDLH